MKCIFSIDVEDWFHILDLPSTPQLSAWDALPSHVEKNFGKLLDLLSESDVRATCFFLGWLVRKFPHLAREAVERGHEIASHGYSHRLVYQMSEHEFYNDAVTSKKAIEDVVGEAVLGYRASGFSITKDTPWFFDALDKAGYQYDSSIFPVRREHGGLKSNQFAPYVVATEGHGMIEFPMTVAKVMGTPLCFFGGGYLRLFPYPVIRSMTQKVLKEGRPVIFYVHPREIDPDHPRLPMGLRRRYKCYVNLKTTEDKIRRLFATFEMSTFRDFLAEQPIRTIISDPTTCDALVPKENAMRQTGDTRDLEVRR
jgi:polysaccharide deacetylase family protein (PEP-CTERM system associated)